MNSCIRELKEEGSQYDHMVSYLSADGGYWQKDVWTIRDEVFKTYSHRIPKCIRKDISFKSYTGSRIRNEVKYYLAFSLRNHHLSASTVFQNYSKPLEFVGGYMDRAGMPNSFADMKLDLGRIEMLLRHSGITTGGMEGDCYCYYRQFINGLVAFITAANDKRPMLERDIWYADDISGVRISATAKTGKPSISFKGLPAEYREMVKRYFRTLIVRRSWSYCRELEMYLRYFFKAFETHGCVEGFLEGLCREDMENYYTWVMEDYEGKNGTYKSKAVSYIRQFLEYIQLAQYPQAPKTGVENLIYTEDYPRRERGRDTMEKVRYIPEPVRQQLDDAIYELDNQDMRAIYVLLRETGWRGADVLNLRYGNCLDYKWNELEKKYVSYLCGEITKTGIPLHKIPIREEVSDMVKRLADQAASKSNDRNNPEGYLFNTYEGRNMGKPLSKVAFVTIIRGLIKQKDIRDGDKNRYHFKVHALRHTRAMEYAEQGMPIGIIQQILGHCSLQMTLHYAKVSENAMYEKWKETEKLNLFHLEGIKKQGRVAAPDKERIDYPYVRKNLDAVKVPFGTCFKPTKLACRHQMSHCLECGSFCSTSDNKEEYENEIQRVRKLMEISRENGRDDWTAKNREYLDILEKMLERIYKEGIIHKNGNLQEEK